MTESATAARFDGRVDDYERARPGYPSAVIDFLESNGALSAGSVVADIGAGTGLFTELFLFRGFETFAVEPNAGMRAAAERRFAVNTKFRSVAGTAEATGLAGRSVDLVVAAQAFHWFEPKSTRGEWVRILRPPRRVALVWNSRRASGSPFLGRYERLLLEFGTDYEKVGHRGVGADRLHAFFGGPYVTFRAPNAQRLDRDGVRSRLLSSSYVPSAGTERHRQMLAELDRILDDTAEGGEVDVVYDCELFLGELREER